MPGAPQQWDVAFVEFVDGSGRVVERLGGTTGGMAPRLSAPYNPDSAGKLAPKYWAANKALELHWFQGAGAHAHWDDGSQVTEKEFDAAVEGAKGIQCSVQAHHHQVPTLAPTASVRAVLPIPPAREPK